jgi:soluble lytic murein transglycosylase-like protein
MALTRRKNNAAVATYQTANVMKTVIATIVAVITAATIATNFDTPKMDEPEKTVQNSIASEQSIPEATEKTTAEAPASEPEPVVAQPVQQATPAVQPAPAGNGSCEQYRSLFTKYSDWDVPTAMAIAHAESTCNPSAHNASDGHDSCTGSHGLMQVACFWAGFYKIPQDSLYDPATNVEIAHRIYQRQGSFYPWTTWTGGKYKQYLSLYQ